MRGARCWWRWWRRRQCRARLQRVRARSPVWAELARIDGERVSARERRVAELEALQRDLERVGR